jgi:hypothetical protein
MQAQLIKTGFHRIGLILASPLAAAAAGIAVAALYTWAMSTPDSEVLAQGRALERVACAGCSAVLGALVYAVTWAVGWVVALLSG